MQEDSNGEFEQVGNQPTQPQTQGPALDPLTSHFLRMLETLTAGQNTMGEVLSRIAAVQIQQAQTIAAAPIPNQETKRTPEAKVAAPDAFDGKMENYDTFRRQLSINFNHYQEAYEGNPRKRIFFALSYMKEGTAATWANTMVDNIEAGRFIITTWEDFQAQMSAKFEDPDKRRRAQNRLDVLRQGVMSADDFFIKFEEYKDVAGYNDEGYIEKLRKALNDRIVYAIHQLPVMPTTYDGWKLYATRLDRNMRDYDVSKGVKPGGVTTERRVESKTTEKKVDTHNRPQTHTTTTSTSSQVVPMDIDRSRTGGNIRDLKCYSCGEKGHIARNCPKPKTQQKIRAYVGGLSEGEKRELARMLAEEEGETEDKGEGSSKSAF